MSYTEWMELNLPLINITGYTLPPDLSPLFRVGIAPHNPEHFDFMGYGDLLYSINRSSFKQIFQTITYESGQCFIPAKQNALYDAAYKRVASQARQIIRSIPYKRHLIQKQEDFIRADFNDVIFRARNVLGPRYVDFINSLLKEHHVKLIMDL
jgi:hypothetical protein